MGRNGDQDNLDRIGNGIQGNSGVVWNGWSGLVEYRMGWMEWNGMDGVWNGMDGVWNGMDGVWNGMAG